MQVNPHLYIVTNEAEAVQGMFGSIWGWDGTPSASEWVAAASKPVIPFSLATFDVVAAVVALGQTLAFPLVLAADQQIQGLVIFALAMLAAHKTATSGG
jgi:hypothetical protein